MFVVILGALFIVAGAIVSTMLDGLEVVSVGMGIIGLFLILLPFTSVVKS
ncbi:MAG: hypothetical protein ACLFU5_06405 [Thermoplasmata archaeon]